MLDWVLNASLRMALSSVKKGHAFREMQQMTHNVLKMSSEGPRGTCLGGWFRTSLGRQNGTSPEHQIGTSLRCSNMMFRGRSGDR